VKNPCPIQPLKHRQLLRTEYDNSYVSKQLNMSQIKVLVFSEELAREGIEKYINALMRGREFRPHSYVIVARGTGNAAERYLRAVEPELESNPAKYYEMLLSAYTYTGFTANTSLTNFYKNMVSESTQPLAVLADISKFEKSDDINMDNSSYQEKGREFPLEGDFKAGDMPKVGTIKSEVMGLPFSTVQKWWESLTVKKHSFN